MNIIIYALILHLMIVFITDYTDATKLIKKIVCWIATKGRIVTAEYECKILECSLCQTWWSTWLLVIVYALIVEFNPLMLLIPLVSAYLTKHTAQLYFLLDDILMCIFS